MAKTWELSGAALDYAVAIAECGEYQAEIEYDGIGNEYPPHRFSTSSQGDAIIDHEKISTLVHHSGVWLAYLGFNHNDDRKFMTSGSTRREAAMRCWARSKLGDEIDIPKELTDG